MTSSTATPAPQAHQRPMAGRQQPSANINPSNLAGVIGDYAQADAAALDADVQAAQAAFAAWLA
jgi:acyl-CoA reductase-like NAD-dependent aldehyde dehydrogenase